MLHGMRLVDAHVHIARHSTMRLDTTHWHFGGDDAPRALYDGDLPSPQRLDDLMDAEGVDVVLLMSEHSPRVTGLQPIDDLLYLAEHDAARYRLVANVNPHVHYPIKREVVRQLDLGAVALKVHPVHG